jgi:hypothetical protein
MPFMALHKLQVSVNHEVQSRAHKHLVKFHKATEKRDTLEIIYERDKMETQAERECMNGLEKKFEGTYNKIMKTTQMEEIIAAEKIDHIAQAIEKYQKEIENI